MCIQYITTVSILKSKFLTHFYSNLNIFRWGSVVSCLESIASNKHNLQALAIDEGLENIFKKDHSEVKKNLLSEIFWDRISGYLQLLSPISLAITKIESDKPMISEVLNIFDELEKHVENNLCSSPFSNVEKQKVVEVLQKRKDFCITSIHEAANLLDPSKVGRNLNSEKQVRQYSDCVNCLITFN